MKNIFINMLKANYFSVIIKKIIKRFEKNTSQEALKFAKLNTKYSTEEFCRLIDELLYDEIKYDVSLILNRQ